MLCFSTNQNQKQTCAAISEAWQIVEELADMAAEHTSNGWDMVESATLMADQSLEGDLKDHGAQQTAFGMSVSEHACQLEEQIRAIAEVNGCRLPRLYG